MLLVKKLEICNMCTVSSSSRHPSIITFEQNKPYREIENSEIIEIQFEQRGGHYASRIIDIEVKYVVLDFLVKKEETIKFMFSGDFLAEGVGAYVYSK